MSTVKILKSGKHNSCIVPGCKNLRRIQCRNNVLYFNNKHCGVHANRLQKYGTVDLPPKSIFGEPWISSNGYIKIRFYDIQIAVHRLVDIINNGPLPQGWDVYHVDGNRRNNHDVNLQRLSRTDHHKLHGNQYM